MNRFGKVMLTVCALALMVGASGCGGSSPSSTTTVTPTIVVVNGYQGYYLNGQFCDWVNNYCGTGDAYTIAIPAVIYYNGYYGYYDNSVFCDWTNDYCGTGISYGIIDNGTYCDYTYCGGTVTWSTGTVGSTGTTGGTSGSTGTTGGTSGSTGTTGGTSGSTGTTGSTYTGTTSGSTGTTGGTSTSGSTGTSNSTNSGYSISGQTKDVDLMAAQLQIATIQARAVALANQFGMSMDSAVQVTQLADRMKALTSAGKQMTAEDQAALLDAAYGVAGVNAAQVNAAAASYIKSGDQSGVSALLDQAATHMGMSSTAALRDQILPSLGINLNAKK